MSGLIIAVHRSESIEFGPHQAMLIQQLRWWLQINEAEWFTGKAEELANLTGFPVDRTRRDTRELVESGVIERQQFRSKWGDQTYSYRINPDYQIPPDRSVSASGKSASAASGKSASPASGRTANSSTVRNRERKELPPLPPHGGPSSDDGQQQLEGTTEPETRAARRKRLASVHEQAFNLWWDGLGVPASQRGSKDSARKAYLKRIEADHTQAEIEAHRERWTAARALWREKTGRDAPVMHGSRLLNGKFDLFDHDWSEDEVREYWVMPDGVEWGKGKRFKSRAEIHAMREAGEI